MELEIEGILETLLVGAIVALALLSLVFFFYGPVLRIDWIRKSFKFLLYEQEHVEPEAEEKEKSASPGGSGERKEPAFLVLLVVALLYGLGVMAESWSHAKLFDVDRQIKQRSFETLAGMQFANPSTPASLRRFITDYFACKTVGAGKNGAGKDTPDLSPCDDVLRQEEEFYYSAKNVVFEKHTYHQELESLQSRIDFVRSADVMLGILTGVVVFVLIVATASEHFFRRKDLIPSFQRLYDLFPEWLKELAHHWRDLDALRCLIIAVGLASFTFFGRQAWEECEDRFDKKVFGYFLSLETGQTVENEITTEKGKLVPNEGPKSVNVLDVIPRSPYFLFGLPRTGVHEEVDADKFRDVPAFEPSAIQPLGTTPFMIVSNDRGGATPFVVFQRSATDALSNPRLVRGPTPNSLASPSKFEALHTFDQNGTTYVLAATTFGSPKLAEERIVWFSVDPCVGAGCKEASVTSEITPLHLEPADPCPVPANAADHKGSCVIEGLTFEDDAHERLLLGVRYLAFQPLTPREPAVRSDEATPPEKEDLGTARAGDRLPALMIIELVRQSHGDLSAQDVWKATRSAVMKPPTIPGTCPRWSGISDLERVGSTLLMLTSVELRDDQLCEPRKRADKEVGLPEVAQVRGALWSLPLRPDAPKDDKKPDGAGFLSNSNWNLVQTFAHKPEGVGRLDEGSVIVVYDDDAQRKSNLAAPRTFPLDQKEAVFSIVRLPAR